MKMSLPGKPIKNGKFNSGLYILSAPTKGGKTLCSLSLAIQEGFSYLYVNEPRSVVDQDFITFFNNTGLVDRDSLLNGIQNIKQCGLIVDSIGDLFQSPKREQGLGKGMSYDQQIYFKSVQRACFKAGVTLIGTVNSRLVPSIENFEGTTEGFIRIVSLKELVYVDRDARKEVSISLKKESLSEACKHLGYGEYKEKEDVKENDISPNSLRF